MQTDLEQMRNAYDGFPEREWERLVGGAQAWLEFVVTMHAIGNHLPPVSDRTVRVLDAGGGPGRYTIALAEQGYGVSLLDLSPRLL